MVLRLDLFSRAPRPSRLSPVLYRLRESEQHGFDRTRQKFFDKAKSYSLLSPVSAKDECREARQCKGPGSARDRSLNSAVPRRRAGGEDSDTMNRNQTISSKAWPARHRIPHRIHFQQTFT